MTEKSTDPAPKAAEGPRAPQVASGVQTSLSGQLVPGMVQVLPAAEDATEVVVLPSGDRVTIQLDMFGKRKEVIDVVKADGPPADLATRYPAPAGEYGYRPEPIPGPSLEQMELMGIKGMPEQPTSQELIMQRAQAQADAIMAAAQNAVTNMDRAEAAARGEGSGAAPDLAHVSVLDPNTGVVQPDQSVPLTNDDDARVEKAAAKTETKSNK